MTKGFHLSNCHFALLMEYAKRLDMARVRKHGCVSLAKEPTFVNRSMVQTLLLKLRHLSIIALQIAWDLTIELLLLPEVLQMSKRRCLSQNSTVGLLLRIFHSHLTRKFICRKLYFGGNNSFQYNIL